MHTYTRPLTPEGGTSITQLKMKGVGGSPHWTVREAREGRTKKSVECIAYTRPLTPEGGTSISQSKMKSVGGSLRWRVSEAREGRTKNLHGK